MGDSKVVFGVAVGTAFARSAVCPTTTATSDGGNAVGTELVSPSSVARPEIVVNADGDRGTPCIVARRGEGADEEWLVGEAAKSAMAGRDWASVRAWPGQVLIKGFKGERVEVDEGGEGGAGGGDDDVATEEVCTKMLQQVLEQAENFSGESLSDCVLAVPSSYTEEERAAMIHTANMSGFSVMGLIREPVAAALAYYVTSGGASLGGAAHADIRKVLVCDLGGSHLDISVLEEQKGILSLVFSKTIPGVSGRAVAQKIVDLAVAEFRRKCGCDARESRRAMTKLWRECENALKVLSMSQQAEIEIDSLYEGYDLRMRVTRARFEGECFDIFRQCTTGVEAALEEASLAKDEIDLLLLAGGVSRIPKLQSMLSGVFPESTAMKTADVNPEEAVAIGAAVQAQLLTQAGAHPAELDGHAISMPLTVSPLTFGVQLPGSEGGEDASPLVLFKKGAFLPAQQAFLVTKASAAQDNIMIRIVASPEPSLLSGGHTVVAEPAFLVPKDWPKNGQLRVDVELSVDGSLRVSMRSADPAVSFTPQEAIIVPGQAEGEKAG